jgi:hypothetical protein
VRFNEVRFEPRVWSLFALLDWWMDKGMKADPGEMDEVFHRMAWSGLTMR